MEDKYSNIVDFSKPIEEVITTLKKKSIEVPTWSDIEKEYDPKKHPILTDSTLRPKEKTKGGQREVPAKVIYGQEKIATRRMTQMTFAIPVKRVYGTTDESGKEDPIKVLQSRAMEKIYKSIRIDGENNNRFKAYFAACEAATIWYTVESPNKNYGFDSKFKLRCRSYSPMPQKQSRITQASIYPIFDEFDDLVIISFEYERIEGGDTVKYFETYTFETHYKWKQQGGAWEEAISPEPIYILKHPVIYIWRPLPIWEDTSTNREEIEFTLSRTSDIIRKNSKPIIKVVGELEGTAPVGDTAREVYTLKAGGDLGLVAPPVTTDAVDFYTNQLQQNTEEELQLPNLSLTNVKDLGNIGEGARKTLLADGHLKVGEEKWDIIRFLDRESNIIKAFLGQMNVQWKDSIQDLEVEHIITPFVQNDKQTDIDTYGKAVSYGLLSRRTALKKLDLVENPDTEIELIDQELAIEAERARVVDVFAAGT